MKATSHLYSQIYQEYWDPIIHLEFMGLFEQGINMPETVKGEVLLVHEYMKSGRYLN